VQGRVESARGVLERARDIPIAPEVAAEQVEHARTLEQLAWVCVAEDRIQEGEDLFHRAIARLEGNGICEYRESAEMRYRLSVFYAGNGQYEKAEDSLIAALHAAEGTTEVCDLEIADFREQYAEILTALGRHEEAAAQIAEVKRIWQDSGVRRDDL
jgi:tetratricopeptide (TPR) repeat protein